MDALLSPDQLRSVARPFRWLARACWALIIFFGLAFPAGLTLRSNAGEYVSRDPWIYVVVTLTVITLAFFAGFLHREGRRWIRASRQQEGPVTAVHGTVTEAGHGVARSGLYIDVDGAPGSFITVYTRTRAWPEIREGDRVTVQFYWTGGKAVGALRHDRTGNVNPVFSPAHQRSLGDSILNR